MTKNNMKSFMLGLNQKIKKYRDLAKIENKHGLSERWCLWDHFKFVSDNVFVFLFMILSWT